MTIQVKIPPPPKGLKLSTPTPIAKAAGAPRLLSAKTVQRQMAEGGDATLTKPQRTLLQSLAWWKAMGHEQPSRVQVAVICGWKTTGSNLKDRVSELFRLGMIEKPSDNKLALTVAGETAAPEPNLSQELIESLRNILTSPQQALFDVLPADGSEISREDAAAALQWNPVGSNMKDRVSELFRLEVITKPSKETIARQEWVR